MELGDSRSSRKLRRGQTGNDEENQNGNDERAERVERSPHPAFHPRKHSAHPRSATTDRPTTFWAILCRTAPKTAAKHPKTGPSIMFFAIFMSDGLNSNIFRKISTRDKRIFL